jgi:hypothetical protein
VEAAKPADERGRFLNPTEHGQPAERGLAMPQVSGSGRQAPATPLPPLAPPANPQVAPAVPGTP